ncbi:hypothetical protein IL308_12510 [Lactococcus lactis]|nr:hypothetical protein [Lactococcus lactis]MBK5077569.1 hypothetical protein [Lactococcus lactis]
MDKEIIQKLKGDLFKNLPLSISEGRKNLFLYLLLVNATRAHNNKLSSSLFPNFYKELTGKSDILVKLAATLHNYFKLSTVELEFNLILLYTFPEFYQFEDKLFYTLNILEKKAPCTFYNIISFLIFIKKNIQHGILILKTEEIYYRISYPLISPYSYLSTHTLICRI